MRFCAVIALLLTIAGCGGPDGPERASVRGKVTFDGVPLTEGDVRLIPADGNTGPAAGGKITNGEFEVTSEQGPTLGAYQVEIVSYQSTGEKVEAGPPNPPGTMIDVIKQLIPARYNTNTELKESFKSGVNEVSYDLKSE